MKRIIVLFGPPGSGKGTQARLLSSYVGAVAIGMGDLLRAEIESGSDIGILIKPIMDSGGAPETSIVMKVLENRINNIDEKFLILEGFPRDIKQAEALEKVLCDIQATLSAAFLLSVDESKLVARMVKRVICSGCGAIYSCDSGIKNCVECGSHEFTRRADDNEQVAKSRIELDKTKAADLIKKYEDSGILFRINGSDPAETVFSNIKKELQKLSIAV